MTRTRNNERRFGFPGVEPGQGRILLFMAALMILFGWAGAGLSGIGGAGAGALGNQTVWIEIVSAGIPHHIRPFDQPPLQSDLLKTFGLDVPEHLEDTRINRSCRAVIHRGSSRITIRPLSGAAALVLGRRIHINLAAHHDLVQISGIGPVNARRIIQERKKNGPFQSIHDLARVRGIGPETIDRIAPYVTTESGGRFLETNHAGR